MAAPTLRERILLSWRGTSSQFWFRRPYAPERLGDFRLFHEDLPAFSGEMVFDHGADGAHIDADVHAVGNPVLRKIEGVEESIRAPESLSVLGKHLHHAGLSFIRDIGHGTECGGRRDGAIVFHARRMGFVA